MGIFVGGGKRPGEQKAIEFIAETDIFVLGGVTDENERADLR